MLAAIDRMRHADDSADPAPHQQRLAAQRAATGATVRSMLESAAVDKATRTQFEAAFAAAGVWLAARERTKTNIIRFTQEARLLMRELGRRMVERGHFRAIEDFAFLEKGEYPGFFAEPEAYAARLDQRRAQWEELAALEPQFVFETTPDFPAAWVRRDAVSFEQLRPGDVLQGIPGCTGIAEGRARVILDSDDPGALGPGDVLVAPSTDPSWTPLFVPAGAVIVDVGAPLSHAVIVSRELGIPCVISATGATKRIPDGAMVRVDGTAGTVTLL